MFFACSSTFVTCFFWSSHSSLGLQQKFHANIEGLAIEDTGKEWRFSSSLNLAIALKGWSSLISWGHTLIGKEINWLLVDLMMSCFGLPAKKSSSLMHSSQNYQQPIQRHSVILQVSSPGPAEALAYHVRILPKRLLLQQELCGRTNLISWNGQSLNPRSNWCSCLAARLLISCILNDQSAIGKHLWYSVGEEADKLEGILGVKVLRHKYKKPQGGADELETYFG